MGRPACSSCCQVSIIPVNKSGCVKDDYKAYYKVGGGGWKTADGYDDYLRNAPVNIVVGVKVNYPIGSKDEYIVDEIIEGVAPDPDRVRLSNDQVPNLLVDISEVKPVKRESGFRGLTAIKYVSGKSDSGEYASEVGYWNFPKAFFVQGADIGPPGPWIHPRVGRGDYWTQFTSGDPNYGIHMPALWTVTLGGGNEEIVITRRLVGSTQYDDWSKGYDTINTGRSAFGSSSIQILTNVHAKTYAAEWTQDIRHNGRKISDSHGFIPYKREIQNYGLYKNQAAVPHSTGYFDVTGDVIIPTPGPNGFGDPLRNWSYNLLGLDTKNARVFQTAGSEMASGRNYYIGYDFLDFCLAFPFFKFYSDGRPATYSCYEDRYGREDCKEGGYNIDPVMSHGRPKAGHTHYFDTGNNCNTAGNIEDRDVQFYHADKKLFTKISVESTNFRVFNPYSNVGPEGLGRVITNAELADYEGETLKKQDEFPLVTTTTFFQYTDNKIRVTSDIPQFVIAQNDSLGGIVDFPTGWPGLGQPGGGSVDRLRWCMSDNEYGLGYRYSFNAQTGKSEYKERDNQYPQNLDLIFVSFRTNRSANESGIDITDEGGNLKDDVEVYHPVGSDNKHTIDEIIEKGPNLKPIKVKLSNGVVVNMSDIELLQDMFQYIMNKSVYNLQLSYLKSLGGDFYNPFKYRVTRIDVTNPNIDIDCIGDEIAGHPNMVDIEVGVKVLYPIGLDANGNPVVSDEYTIAKIIDSEPDGQGGTRPIKVKLGNGPQPHISPEVDVSDIELINPNENPTYIKMTQDYSWSDIIGAKDRNTRGSGGQGAGHWRCFKNKANSYRCSEEDKEESLYWNLSEGKSGNSRTS